MLWLILGLIIGISIAIRVRRASKLDVRNDFLSRFMPIPIVVLGVLIGVLFAAVSPAVCSLFVPVKYQEVASVDVVRLIRTTTRHGEYVDYYLEDTDGARKVNSERATVVMSEQETPRIVTYQPRWKNQLLYLVAWKCPVPKHYMLFLPGGSINTSRCSICKTYTSANFCPYCGRQIPRMPLCSACGCQWYEEQKSCVRCGTSATIK